MSYLALARKWRPRRFDEMVGQEHVRRALSNALGQERVHHAYLFTGTRGVGKTTIARIFAKCLNCEQGVSTEPCGQCDACISIDQGRFMDLIEVDAASRTKVEDTRELLENVQYAPASGRFKVYLIDEVHMLSTSSFNALLKTLEEPPLHAKFLLATTDPQKLPATVLSRCLQFSLKPMTAAMIKDHLAFIAAQEAIDAETDALNELALAARGSMRDALSLMDQAVGLGGGRIGSEDVALMLGSIARERVSELLQALAAGDSRRLLDQVEQLASIGTDFETLLGQLLAHLHRLALGQLVPGVIDDLGDEDLRRLAEVLHPEDVQLWYQIGLMGRKDLPFAPDPRSGVEMILLRMLVFRPQRDNENTAPGAGGRGPATDGPGEARRPPVSGQGVSSPPAVSPARAALEAARSQTEVSGAAGADPGVPRTNGLSAPAETGDAKPDWSAVVASLPVSGLAQQLAYHAELKRLDEGQIVLSLDPAHANLNTTTFADRLRSALSQHFGRALELRIEVGETAAQTPAALATKAQAERMAGAREALVRDPFVNALQDVFDARLDEASIRPPGESH